MNSRETGGGMTAGAAKRVMRYPEGFFPYTGFKGRYLTGIHDDLHARAVAVGAGGTTVLIISVELGDVSGEWLPEISRATGVPVENICLCATHTHSAPYAGSTWPERVGDEEKTHVFTDMLRDTVVEAAGAAVSAMVPATLRFAEGECTLNVNRDRKNTTPGGEVTAPYISANNPHGFSDHTLAVARFEDVEGGVIAYVMNYAIHSAVVFHQKFGEEGEGMRISGDLAGAAMRYVEERSDGDTVALYTLGCAADQQARYVMMHPVFARDGSFQFCDYGDEAGYAFVDAYGAELGEELFRVCAAMAAGVGGAPIRAATCTVTHRGKQEWRGGPPTKVPADYRYTPTEPMEVPMGLIRLGDLGICWLPAEVVASVGADLKTVLRENGCRDAVVISQCNGSYSYTSDDRGYRERTFEAVASHFMPGIGTVFCDGAKKLCGDVFAG